MHGMRICPLDISPTAREIINFPNPPGGGGGGGIAPGSPPPVSFVEPFLLFSANLQSNSYIFIQILKSYDWNGDAARSFFWFGRDIGRIIGTFSSLLATGPSIGCNYSQIR